MSATPQELLDQIHAINIPGLWDSEITRKERGALIKLHKQKLRTVKQALKEAEDVIDRRYDGRNKTEAAVEKLLLTPYALIGQVITGFEDRLSDLQHAVEFDRPLPDVIRYGTIVYGSIDYGSYVIASAKDLRGIQQELIEKGKILKAVRGDLEGQKIHLKSQLTDEATIASVTKSVNNQALFAFFLFFILFALVVAMYAFIGKPNAPDTIPVFGGAIFILIVLIFIISASVRRLQNKILKPHLAKLAEIKVVDDSIAKTDAAMEQTKKFYDEARDGLKRIAETTRPQQSQ